MERWVRTVVCITHKQVTATPFPCLSSSAVTFRLLELMQQWNPPRPIGTSGMHGGAGRGWLIVTIITFIVIIAIIIIYVYRWMDVLPAA